MSLIINGIKPPKGYSDQFQYFSVTSDKSIDSENQIRANLSDFPHVNKIIAIKERLEDWLVTVSK